MPDDAESVEQLRAEIAALRQQQAATSEILRVIASSPSDPTTVLDAIAAVAARYTESEGGAIQQVVGDRLRWVGLYGRSREGEKAAASHGLLGNVISAESISGRTLVERRTIHVPDVAAAVEREFPASYPVFQAIQQRSQVTTPLLRQGQAIGVLGVHRWTLRPYTDQQIAVLEVFADQAVIAIENARLFTELEQRNAELQESNRRVTEALEQQTATAEVLRVIASSPTNLQEVLQAITDTAARLCGATGGSLYQVEGDRLRTGAFGGSLIPTEPGLRDRLLQRLRPIEPGLVGARAVIEGRAIHSADLLNDPDFPTGQASARLAGHRTTLAVPLLRDGAAVGSMVMVRMEVHPFSDREIEMLETFADQAVIALENARLFTELEQRNADLQESNSRVTETLEQQTATAEVLQVIASSPNDVQPVLDAVVETVSRLCEAEDVVIYRSEGDRFVLAAWRGEIGRAMTASAGPGERIGPLMTASSVIGRAWRERRQIQVENLAAAADEYPNGAASAQRFGHRTTLATPLLRPDEPIGVICVYRTEVRPFTERQMALLRTFADQAVIAIENVRLFQELQDRTAQLARSVGELRALGEVGQAVSASLDVQEVLAAILAHAVQLSGADGGVIYEYDEHSEQFQLRSTVETSQALADVLRDEPLRMGEGAVGRAALARVPVQTDDIDAEDRWPSRIRGLLVEAGYRALLAVPVLREDRVLGGMVVARRSSGSFPPEAIALLQTFASQSALAIQNARLFQEIEAQSRALEIVSQHKSQFLANMSHELRTPLNAIIGYSEMLQEEVEDLGEQALVGDLVKINAAGKHLLGLINDILDLSKIEAGRMDLFLETFSVPDLVRGVVAIVRPLVEKNGNTLVVSNTDDLGSMHADQTKVRQALFNLLSNACKFTDHGTITLSVVREAGDWLTFEVADTGIGMTEEQIGRLFEAFSQAEVSTRSQYGGTGLGLALSRQFCRLMAGDVTVSSVYGTGSTFTIRLPAVVREHAAALAERQG
jgi:two-component system, NtrC family, sensor kinase